MPDSYPASLDELRATIRDGFNLSPLHRKMMTPCRCGLNGGRPHYVLFAAPSLHLALVAEGHEQHPGPRGIPDHPAGLVVPAE